MFRASVQMTPATDLARQLMAIWEHGDIAAIEALTTDDVVYDDVPNGKSHRGRLAVGRYVRHVHSWASRIQISVDAVYGNPDAAVAEWTLDGVQDRPIRGRVPVATGRPFRLRGATVVVTRNGRIARAADYIDVLGFVLDLGARVELPGGGVMQRD